MPHRVDHVQGQGRYGFGTGMPEDVFGAFSNAAPFVRPEYNEEQFRAAMGFVPVAGTAYNWNQMGPWGRAGSLGLDALDVLTAGSGKALTTPLKAFSKWINPAQMRFLRFGEVPTTGGYDRALGQLPGSPVASSWDIGSFGGASEPGVSVYKSLLDPKTGKYVLENEPVERYGKFYRPGKELLEELRIPSADIQPVVQSDLISEMVEQYNKPADYLRARTQQPFEVRGNPMTALGSDLETQLYPRSIPLPTGQTPISPTQIVRESAPSRTLLGETLSNVPNVSFDKIDEFGRPILNSWQKLIQQASRARPGSTIPYTTTGRSGLDWNEADFAWNTPGLFGGVAPQRPYQTPFNLEEQYQQQARRRGGWSPGG